MVEINKILGTNTGCNICNASIKNFKDYNGRSRKCGVCGSLERQRAFASLIESGQLQHVKNANRILLISPANCEIQYFKNLVKKEITVIYTKPALEANLITDISYLPDIDCELFDIIYANYVLSHISNFNSALSELHRILTPDGLFINYEPLGTNKVTDEKHDINEICAHYGREVYEKYQIGSFRVFGSLDIDTKFMPLFKRQAWEITEGVTGNPIIWNVWKKQLINNNYNDNDNDIKIVFSVNSESIILNDHKCCLAEDEWLFLKDHVVKVGVAVKIYGRLTSPEKRSIPIFDAFGTVVAYLNISGCFSKEELDRFDKDCSVESGAPTHLDEIIIPTILKPGFYFIDGSWVFFVCGDINKSDTVIVLPITTMHFFNDTLGGSIYDQKYKNLSVLSCSTNRPLHKKLLVQGVYFSEPMMQWILRKFETQSAAYISENEVTCLSNTTNLKLVIIVGRSEDWTSESRHAISQLIQSGVNIMCVSAETMYHDIQINKSSGTVQRDRQRYRWVEKEGKNSLRDLIGSNPYDGGFLIKMSGPNDPGYGKFTVVDHEDRVFKNTNLLNGSTITLSSVAYDGLPILYYNQKNFPVFDFFDFSTWKKIDILGFCCGANSPDKRVGVFARFDAGVKAGKCIHMGSMSWGMEQAFENNEITKNHVTTILSNVIDELLETAHDS